MSSADLGAGGDVKLQRAIDAVIAQMSFSDIYDCLVEFRDWVATDADGVKDQLAQRPVVAQALLKMQIKMGMLHTPPPIDASYGVFAPMQAQPQTVLTTGYASMAPQPGGAMMMPPPPQQPLFQQPPPHMMLAGRPGQYSQQQQQQQQPMPLYPQQKQQAAPAATMDPRTYTLFAQALNMTEQQLLAFPPQQQHIFRQIRYNAGMR